MSDIPQGGWGPWWKNATHEDMAVKGILDQNAELQTALRAERATAGRYAKALQKANEIYAAWLDAHDKPVERARAVRWRMRMDALRVAAARIRALVTP